MPVDGLKPPGEALDVLREPQPAGEPAQGSWLRPREPVPPARPFLFFPIFWNDLGERPGNQQTQAAIRAGFVSFMLDAAPPDTGQHQTTMRPEPGQQYWLTLALQNYG